MTASSTNESTTEIAAPQSIEQPAPEVTGDIYRIKCYLETGHTFVGWLYYYGNHYAGYTGTEDTQSGLKFSWYEYGGVQYLWDIDSLGGSARYLGPYKADDHASGELNLWAKASGILYNQNGDRRFRQWNNHSRYCFAAGSSYIYWGDYGEALQFEFVLAT
jgi:hypothetical protein